MKPFCWIVFLVTTFTWASEDWGPTGHRATAEIAQQYLSKKAKKKIHSLLNGQSLALVSTFADEIKSDPRYKEINPWHYVNFPFDSTYEAHPKSERGDIVEAIQKCISMVKDVNTSKEDKAFYLKLLVHFIGDLHQPLHMGLAKDKGGNDFQVQWFNEGTNLHAVWDEKILDQYGMSYSELAANTQQLSREQLAFIQEGSVTDWMYESRALCLDVYEHTQVGEKLGYGYMYRYSAAVREQLQKGGIRLAVLLNAIFQ